LGFWRVLGTRISSFLLVMTMTGINGIQSGQESTGTEMRQGQALDRLTKFVILSPRSSRAYWTNNSGEFICNTRRAVGVSLVNKLESDEWETWKHAVLCPRVEHYLSIFALFIRFVSPHRVAQGDNSIDDTTPPDGT